MDNSIYDHMFPRTVPEGMWESNNRILEEANELLVGASRPAQLESHFSPASMLNGAGAAGILTREGNTKSYDQYGSGDLEICFPADGCNYNYHQNQIPNACGLWNVGNPDQQFTESLNFLKYGDYCNSFKAENPEANVEFSLNYQGPYDKFAADFQHNVLAGTSLDDKIRSDMTYEAVLGSRVVDPSNNNYFIQSLNDHVLQNELDLIYGNLTGGYNNMREDYMKSSNIGDTQAHYATSLNQNEEIKGRISEIRPFSPLLNESKPLVVASLQNTELIRKNITETVSMREENTVEPLITSNKTEVHSENEQSPQISPSKEKMNCGHNLEANNAGTQEINNTGGNQEVEKHSQAAEETENHNPRLMATLAEGDQSNCSKVGAGHMGKNKGQPAKNLMAERRRRKRLNERLCMLRSVVPTISKMDRTSILSDTIDYMKELLQQVRLLHRELEPPSDCPAHLRAIHGGYFRSSAALDQGFIDKDSMIKNIPKFEVQRINGRSKDLNIQMSCPTNPNLLLSTINTLESFGVDIQQGIISCFNDFGMQAYCSEQEKDRSIRPEDIKLALLQTAGYLGNNE
eukprot:Gb_15096 [translate_table: standard]